MENEKLNLRKAKLLILDTVDNMDTEIFEMCSLETLDSLVDKYTKQYLENVKVLKVSPENMKMLTDNLNKQLIDLIDYYKDPKWEYLFSK